MYSSTTQQKLALTEQKLKATEKLLEIEKTQHKVTQHQLTAARASHKLQQTNTGIFFEEARQRGAELKAIKAELEALKAKMDEDDIKFRRLKASMEELRRMLCDDKTLYRGVMLDVISSAG